MWARLAAGTLEHDKIALQSLGDRLVVAAHAVTEPRLFLANKRGQGGSH